jgi:hypothetical protein
VPHLRRCAFFAHRRRWGTRRGFVFAVFWVDLEGPREQFAEAHGAVAIGGGENDRRIGHDELSQHLAAGSAGRTRGGIEIGDGDGLDANVGSELGNGPHQSGTLGANGQSVAHILHIRPGNDFAVRQLQRRADAKAGVGCVRVQRGLARVVKQAQKRGFRRGWNVHWVSDFSKAWK